MRDDNEELSWAMGFTARQVREALDAAAAPYSEPWGRLIRTHGTRVLDAPIKEALDKGLLADYRADATQRRLDAIEALNGFLKWEERQRINEDVLEALRSTARKAIEYGYPL